MPGKPAASDVAALVLEATGVALPDLEAEDLYVSLDVAQLARVAELAYRKLQEFDRRVTQAGGAR